jgi:DNA-binding NtrC family response regulator
MNGLQVLRALREISPETPCIFLTAFGTIEHAVEAVKLGAYQYLLKPLNSPDELRSVVAKALSHRELLSQKEVSRREEEAIYPFEDMVVVDPAMRRVVEMAVHVASSLSNVLLLGDSGTGKEMIARLIHHHSPRADKVFVAVNCAALPENLLESELFGHEKGAFTGAVQQRAGRFELASGGTLFLDEIGELPLPLQAKILRVVQERKFERLGGMRTLEADVRLLAATNRNLEEAVKKRTFREDLYYRLNVFPIFLPPLKDRPLDILPLAEHFLRKLAPRVGKTAKPLSSEASRRLERHSWPGNVRELANMMERALILSCSEFIGVEDLTLREKTEDGSESNLTNVSPKTLAEVERETIIEALKANGNHRGKTAEALGISLRTLQYKLKEYEIVRAGS